MKSRLVLLPFAVCLLFTGMIFASEDDVVATGRGFTIDRATLEKSAQEDLHQLDLDRKRVEAELEKRRYQILSGKLKELVGWSPRIGFAEASKHHFECLRADGRFK